MSFNRPTISGDLEALKSFTGRFLAKKIGIKAAAVWVVLYFSLSALARP